MGDSENLRSHNSEIDRQLFDYESDEADLVSDCDSQVSYFTPPDSDSDAPETDLDSDDAGLGSTNTTNTEVNIVSPLQTFLSEWNDDNDLPTHNDTELLPTDIDNTNDIDNLMDLEVLHLNHNDDIGDTQTFANQNSGLFHDNELFNNQSPIHINDDNNSINSNNSQSNNQNNITNNADLPAVRLRGRGQTRGRGRGQGRGRSNNRQPAIRGKRRRDLPEDDSWGPFQGLQQRFLASRTAKYNVDIPANSKPIDYYKHIVSDEVIDLMVRETNRNAAQTLADRRLSRSSRLRKWVDVDAQDMKKFMGLLIWMGLASYPRITDYWSNNTLYKNHVTIQVMSEISFNSS